MNLTQIHKNHHWSNWQMAPWKMAAMRNVRGRTPYSAVFSLKIRWIRPMRWNLIFHHWKPQNLQKINAIHRNSCIFFFEKTSIQDFIFVMESSSFKIFYVGTSFCWDVIRDSKGVLTFLKFPSVILAQA